jgi:peptidoglycan/xylan/chitin deacetylase (PgdA/CDA1 family)
LIPPGASQPLIKPRSIDDVPILAFTLWGPGYDDHQLRRLAAQLEDDIKQVDRVSAIELIGGERRQILVELDRVALTFDDGYRSVWEEAAPVLERAGAPATLFLTTDYVGRDSRWPTLPADAPVFDLMSWDQARELRDLGWAIEAHTCTHPDLRALSDDAIEDELRRSNDAIEQEIGARPRAFAYPYGHYDARSLRIARQHYELAVTVQMARVERPPDRHRIPRLETFYFRGSRPLGGFGSHGFRAYLGLRALIRALPKP